MANRKRERPLSKEEERERNRQYQQTRREKTNNNYARAYRRTTQRVVTWFQENQKLLWEVWLEEELEKENFTPYESMEAIIEGKVHEAICKHDGEKFVAGIALGCSICGRLLGNFPVEDDDRAALHDALEMTDFEYTERVFPSSRNGK